MPVLLCLHGWGGSKESFMELRQALGGGAIIKILAPDLPGFGSEPDPPQPWGIQEYALWVEQWLVRKNVCGPIALLGHSLGGQIAVALALRSNVPLHHLFLIAPAAIRPRFSIRRNIGFVLAKTGKAVFMLPGLVHLQPLLRKLLYKIMRVHDYEKASSIMQRTMMHVTHEDLTEKLPELSVPVDLFWGTDDRLTPLSNGKRMHTLIPGSTLHIFPNQRHSIHRACATEIAAIIQARIGIP